MSALHGHACDHCSVMTVVNVRLALLVPTAKMLMLTGVGVFGGTVKQPPTGGTHTSGSTEVPVRENVASQM